MTDTKETKSADQLLAEEKDAIDGRPGQPVVPVRRTPAYAAIGMPDADDEAFINSGATPETKRARRDVIELIATLNGEANSVTPGSAMTYIPEENYYQRAVVTNAPAAIAQTIENALNWAALGRNKAAVYGAAIRWSMREHFVNSRETKVVNIDFNNLAQDKKSLMDGYVNALRPVVKQAAFWSANSNNVAALAGALMVSAGHHYDSQNTRPQDALVGALGQSEDVDRDAYRPIFYLSVHPLPLATIERERKKAADGKHQGYSEAVRIRSMGVPSGYGALAIAVAAIDGMVGEKYYGQLVAKYRGQLALMREKLRAVKANPTVYHVNATDYGVQRQTMDLSDIKEVMVIGIAYARYIIKGTMQKAASAKKFFDQNRKSVETWGKAFEIVAEEGATTLAELLATGIPQ